MIFVIGLARLVISTELSAQTRNNPKQTSNNYYFASSILTTDLTLSFFKSVYVCPHPTNITGAPEVYTMESAAPTLSSTVSNFDNTMPSMTLVFVVMVDRSLRRSLNLVVKQKCQSFVM